MKKIIALSVLLLLTGCADKDGNILNPNLFGPSKTNEIAEAKSVDGKTSVDLIQSLDKQAVTAQHFSDLTPFVMSGDHIENLTISQKDKVMHLDSGKSFVRLIKLAPINDGQKLNINSYARETVFAPYAQLLNKDFSAIEGEYQSTFKSQVLRERDRYEMVINIDSTNKTAQYIAIYTHKDVLGKTKQLTDPEQAYNKENGINQPPRPWYTTINAPVGSISLNLVTQE
ncbi:MalM family protein [Vibrio algicola]|uniref:Lipoprotein n=1 Tax=Vibrio algicola TaxID=2662262 RepID=A0A5Q0TCR3_9VIBR|nr:MalM family protein [Vibrio algicola]